MTAENSGTLYGVGLGPGDPELMTLKAVRILREAPVIAHFRKKGRAGHARTIAQAHICAAAVEAAIRLSVDDGKQLSRRSVRRGDPRFLHGQCQDHHAASRRRPRRGVALRGRPLLLRIVPAHVRPHPVNASRHGRSGHHRNVGLLDRRCGADHLRRRCAGGAARHARSRGARRRISNPPTQRSS